MNNTYARGQETFINRIIITLHNLFLLGVASSLVALGAACLYLWYGLPSKFWELQRYIWHLSRGIFKDGGLLAFPEACDYFLTSTFKNYSFFQNEFQRAYLWGLGGGALFFVAAATFFKRRGQKMANPTIIRGTRLLSPKEYNANYKRDLKKQGAFRPWKPSTYHVKSYKDRLGNPFVCGQDRLIIPEEALYRHLAVIGATGVGKTTLINSYLNHCRRNQEKVIIPDINAEYASRFYQPGDVILSLSDHRTRFWDFSCEPVPNEQFAQYLVPSGSEANAFWWKGGRSVLSQLLAQSKTGEDLWNLVNSGDKDLSESLSGLARKISGGQGSGQASGIAGATVLDLGFLEKLNAWPKANKTREEFSVYDWAQSSGDQWVFITFTDSDRAFMGPLLRLWLNLAILGVFERPSAHALPPLNVVIDELASIGQIELLPSAVERARKYGGKVVLGYQSDSQLRNLYAHHADSIRANTGNKFIFRCPDTRDSRDLADFLGRSEVLQPHMSQSYGRTAVSDRENIGEHMGVKNLILDSEIRALQDGEFYLRSLHMNPVRSKVIFKKYKCAYEVAFKMPQVKAALQSQKSSFANMFSN